MRLIVLSLLVALLGGCATPQPPPLVTDESHEQWSQRQQQLAGLDAWSIRGRVALYLDDDVYNLGLGWTRQQQDNRIKLEASLGQGLVLLEKNGHEVKLTTSEGETFYGSNAQQVLWQSTGWSIPIEGLVYWIKGINHPDSAYLPLIDHQGRATSLQQDDWQINFLEYRDARLEQFNNPALPRKMYMKREKVALKILIDQWQAEQNLNPSRLFPDFTN
ncbi:MAG: lipoprotein insertase outer membrane protein LolB [Gammaproteobacteria bacterium]|nr:lipoprotein insertase outer membrane protein LolB [Gammaproteobacteria bacterium]